MQLTHLRLGSIIFLASCTLLGFAAIGSAEWSVETPGAATLPEFGGRATLVIRCSRQEAEPVIYLHQPLEEKHVALSYRFDDNKPQARMAAVSASGKVLQVWREDDKQYFARSKRLRVQLRPFVVLDFDLRGIETVAAKLQCP